MYGYREAPWIHSPTPLSDFVRRSRPRFWRNPLYDAGFREVAPGEWFHERANMRVWTRRPVVEAPKSGLGFRLREFFGLR